MYTCQCARPTMSECGEDGDNLEALTQYGADRLSTPEDTGTSSDLDGMSTPDPEDAGVSSDHDCHRVSTREDAGVSSDHDRVSTREDTETRSDLSSSVVIRRANSLVPTFSKLRPNADLNLPPPNWLRSNNLATFSHYLGRNPIPQSSKPPTTEGNERDVHFEPSSVVLASHYPEAVGRVDVVADAKHIKKLLKLPYCNSLISMAIHRVANKTLLIDEFNAPLLLTRAASANLEKIFQENPVPILPRKKDPSTTHQRNMMSKFLYYSAQNDPSKALVQSNQPGAPPYYTDRPSLSSAAHGEESLTCNSKQDLSAPDCQCTENEESLTVQSTPLKMIEHKNAVSKETVPCDNAQDTSLSEEISSPNSHVQSKSLIDEQCNNTGIIALPPCSLVSITDKQQTRAPSPSNSTAISTQNETNLKSNPLQSDLPVDTAMFPLRTMYTPDTIQVPQESYPVSPEEFPHSLPSMPPQPFHQNVQWSVKDISMLLGSDLPIFGVDGHPAISLRLREMQKPITVLTGMDYWLDNLMCNVPELAMCFHVDGIVQGYDIIKTEDIPKLDTSCQFPPEEVLDVVHNILGFLKANCTREGHTYWLFRKKGEDVVKLYDLTSLNCFQGDEHGSQNPFARSVAVLFYRVAHNMLNSGESQSSEDLAIAKLLLENCIKLIGDRDKEITLSAYCLLSDLFLNKAPVQLDTETSSPLKQSNFSPPASESEDNCIHTEPTSTNAIHTGHPKSFSVSLLREGRCDFSSDADHPLPPLTLGSSLDRARLALEQVSDALSSLNICESSSHDQLSLQPWQVLGTSKLLGQAGAAYLILAEAALKLSKLGRALRYGKYSIICSSASHGLSRSTAQEESNQKSLTSSMSLFNAWQLCGDIHCLSTKLSESFSANLEDFHLENPEDAPVIRQAQIIQQTYISIGEKEETCLSLHTELESSLLRSIDCYELARSVPHSSSQAERNSLEERIGNAWNELGVYYLQVASTINYNKDAKHVEKLWKTSYSCITDGLDHFKTTKNVVNQALLCANLGKLMYNCAQTNGLRCMSDFESSQYEKDEGKVTEKQVKVQKGRRVSEYSQQERVYYSKSAEYYLEAKQLLRRKSVHPVIWTNVVADLSKVYLSMGLLMSDYPPLSYLSNQEVSQEITDVLMKVLHHVESELNQIDPHHQRYLELCKLAGDCHTCMGNLHLKNLSSASVSGQKVKQLKTMTEKHYSKASTFYKVKCHYCEVLELALKKAVLFGQHIQGRSQFRSLQTSLPCLLETTDPLKILSTVQEEHFPANLPSLYCSLVHQLQDVIKQLLMMSRKKSDRTQFVASYKAMYEHTLRIPQLDDSSQIGSEQLELVIEILTRLSHINADIVRPKHKIV